MASSKTFIAARDQLINALNYQQAKAEFAWPNLETFNWALDYFDTLPERCSTPAIIYTDDCGAERRISFQEMKGRSNKAANLLRNLGLTKNDRILLMLNSSVELFEIFLGAMKAGCVIIPASTLLTSEDVRDRIARGKARCIVADAELTNRLVFPSVDTPIPKVSVGGHPNGWTDYADADGESAGFRAEDTFTPKDELLIYFTSGTTAKPKLVLHTHGSYPIGHLTTMYWIGARKGDLHYNISAPGWAKYAYSSIFGSWNAEATTFLYNYTGKFDPKHVLRVIESFGVKTLCAPPTVWRFLLLENLRDYHLSLRELVSAGEPLNPEVIQKVRRGTGLTIREGFGQTETTILAGFFPGMNVEPGSMGVEAPGFHLALLNDDHLPVGVKGEGNVAVRVKPERPIGLMEGYIDPRERNREVFVGDWYLTGDLAFRDESGFFWFIGREDDVFKSSDYRISAFEVESELLAHPSVTEVAVVASPDPLRGFVPKAYVMLKPDLIPSEQIASDIFNFTRNRMAPYKRPRIIQFVNELPKTVSGKIKRRELRMNESKLKETEPRNTNEYFESDLIIARVRQR